MSEISKDLESMIRDQVKASVAEKMIDEARKAAELAPVGANATAFGRGNGQSATVDPVSMQILHDPLKGKGVDFARWARVNAAARGLGQTPKDLAHSWGKHEKGFNRIAEICANQERAFSEGAFASGGSLVPAPVAGELIELLYARTVCLDMGAKTLEFNGAIDMGRINSGVTVAYVQENANIVPSTPGTGKIAMSRKKAAALVGVANELLRNPSAGVDVILRDDMLMALAVRRDLSALRGSGTDGQPKGIKNWIASGNSTATAGTSLANKVTDLTTAIRLVEDSNVPVLNAGFVMSPRTKWALMATLDSNGSFTFAAMLSAGNLFGYPVRTTTSVPTNLGGGAESEIYFGAFNDLIIGFDIGTPLSIDVTPNGAYHDGSAVVSGLSNDSSPIRVMEGHDVALRHNNSFAMVTAVAY